MQPRSREVRSLGWQIVCNNDLNVLIAVVDEYLLLLSQEGGTKVSGAWRMGKYIDAAEAQQRAVEMTGSYERLRHGKVEQPRMIQLDAVRWKSCVTAGEVSPDVAYQLYEGILPGE